MPLFGRDLHRRGRIASTPYVYLRIGIPLSLGVATRVHILANDSCNDVCYYELILNMVPQMQSSSPVKLGLPSDENIARIKSVNLRLALKQLADRRFPLCTDGSVVFSEDFSQFSKDTF